jgi:hypothetical protein
MSLKEIGQSMKQNIHDHSQNTILDLIVEAKTNYEQTSWYKFRTKLKYKQEIKEYTEILIKREQHWKLNNEI